MQEPNIQDKGTQAVRLLRYQKLTSGRPFMINSKELPVSHCYLEFPDGRIVIAALRNHAKDFDIVRELPKEENRHLRLKYQLPALK